MRPLELEIAWPYHRTQNTTVPGVNRTVAIEAPHNGFVPYHESLASRCGQNSP